MMTSRHGAKGLIACLHVPLGGLRQRHNVQRHPLSLAASQPFSLDSERPIDDIAKLLVFDALQERSKLSGSNDLDLVSHLLGSNLEIKQR
jgi:hypothetical protein